MKLSLSREAAADLARLHDFLAPADTAVAQRAVATIVEAIDSLETFAARGRPVDISDMRELIVPFGQSAYVVRYACLTRSDEIVVLRIWHGREQR